MRAIAVAFFLLAAAAHAQEVDDIDCENAVTQMDMNRCAHADFETADTELNAAYRDTMRAMEQTDAELGEINTNYVGAVEALRNAQRGWIAYRDGQCALAGFSARGGSMEPLLVSSCLAEITRKRTDELKALTDGPEN